MGFSDDLGGVFGTLTWWLDRLEAGGVGSTFCGRWNRVHACTALLDVEAMTVDVVVPEEHPLNGLHPVRTPVWWGWKGDVGKRCDVEVHTGRTSCSGSRSDSIDLSVSLRRSQSPE